MVIEVRSIPDARRYMRNGWPFSQDKLDVIAARITSTSMRGPGRQQLGDFGLRVERTFGPDAADRRGCGLGVEGSMPRR